MSYPAHFQRPGAHHSDSNEHCGEGKGGNGHAGDNLGNGGSTGPESSDHAAITQALIGASAAGDHQLSISANGSGESGEGAAGAIDIGLLPMLAQAHADATASGGDAFLDAHSYDGSVALALDPGVLPEIDSTLDLLTSSHDLFDVPALDLGGVIDDVVPT